MSRKHFIALAKAIRESITEQVERERFARALVPMLREANPQFNVAKFIAAAVG